MPSSTSTYHAELPSLTIDPDIPKFFEKFYATSDNPSEQAHEEYARSFTDHAPVIMAAKKVQGYAEILEFRKGLWSGPVVSRLHTVEKIFPFGDNSNEVMLYGTVKYGLKNGKTVVVDWSGRALLVKAAGPAGTKKAMRMSFYQVYMDPTVVANAAKD